jgi:hypothetical protein
MKRIRIWTIIITVVLIIIVLLLNDYKKISVYLLAITIVMNFILIANAVRRHL